MTAALLMLALAAPRDVSGLLAPIRERHGVPALGGAVVGLENATAVGVTGVRRRGSDEAAAAGDAWHLGSCTKAMTATLCAMLVEDGELAWDDHVASAFADLDPHPAWKQATLARLLANRAGAPADLDADDLWARLWRRRGTPREQRLELAAGVLAPPPAAADTYLYSNAGFALAGAMAERAVDVAWEELMRRRLFAPLGMETAGFGAPERVRGHRPDGTPVEPGPLADNPPAIAPAGTVHASLEDWARFVALHLRGARGETGLLGRASFSRLHGPPGEGEPRYAMGWLVVDRPWAGGRALTHAGSNTMWYAVVWTAPERGFAVLAACNQGGDAAVRACDEVAAALIARR